MAGFKIPYFTLDGRVDKEFYRFRFVQDKPSKGWGSVGEPEKPRRYSQPANTQCGVYLPPLMGDSWKDVAANPEIPLIITEGEMKAACGCLLVGPSMGLGGVYNWMSQKDGVYFLPILEQFEWRGRQVTLLFDSDVRTNPMVRMAASRLAKALADRGAIVYWAQLPEGPNGEKQGMDDLAYREGAEALEAVLASDRLEKLGPSVMLYELNTKVAIVRATSEIVELVTGNVMSPSAFSDAVYRNYKYMDSVPVGKDGMRAVEKFAAKEWLAWPHRNEVRAMVYEPAAPKLITDLNEYNTWAVRGWACAPSSKGVVTPWLELVARMFAGISKEDLIWVKQWFAYPLQYPGTKLATAMMVWGHQQGTGKTMLGETMKYIYGANYGTVNNLQLSGSFTEWMVDKQFIVGDEISLGDKRHTANALKDMITRPTVRINIKNRKSYSVRDCLNYYFTSNHDDAVYIERNDRRMFVHKVDTLPLSPAEYGRYQKWLQKEGGASRLFYYFKEEVDTATFDPQGKAPITSAKLDMVMSGRGDTEDWAAQLAADPDTLLGQPYDLFTTMDLLAFYDPDKKDRTKSGGLGRALSAAGVYRVANGNNTARINGMRAQFWAVRNADKYKRMGPAAAADAYQEERVKLPPGGVGSHGKFRGTVRKREVIQ